MNYDGCIIHEANTSAMNDIVWVLFDGDQVWIK